MILTETFDILSFKGVEKDIQGLFSKYGTQDKKGQILFDFFGNNGQKVDSEILSLYQNKQASQGVSILNLSENIRSVFVSDSYASLIFFANQYKSRISFEESVFIIIGADFDPCLLKQAFSKIPKKTKVNTVFSSSILGRVMDCKIQDLIQERNSSYLLSGDLVRLKNEKRSRESAVSIFSFSLRTYCISQGIKQTIRTFKPKLKGIETYYQLNKLAFNELN